MLRWEDVSQDYMGKLEFLVSCTSKYKAKGHLLDNFMFHHNLVVLPKLNNVVRALPCVYPFRLKNLYLLYCLLFYDVLSLRSAS